MGPIPILSTKEVTMFYVRYANRQARFDTKQLAWDYTKKLGNADFDIYDSDSKSVVFGSYRIETVVFISGEANENCLYCKTLAQARKEYSLYNKDALQCFVLSHYDMSKRTWVVVYDNNAKVA
jgi:hypothetical protein